MIRLIKYIQSPVICGEESLIGKWMKITFRSIRHQLQHSSGAKEP